MGGDATRYIHRAEEVVDAWSITPRKSIETLFTNSWYPGVIGLVVMSNAIPFEWPRRIIVITALAQIAAGVSIGWLLYRVFSWQSAAAGIAFWAMTPVVAIRDFDDGTIAQLLSYSVIFLLLERFHNARPFGVIAALLVSYLIHPLTGVLLTAMLTITLITLLIIRNRLTTEVRKTVYTLSVALFLIIGVAIALSTFRNYTYVLTAFSDIHEPLTHLRKPFVPIALLAPFGLMVLARLRSTAPHTMIALVSLIVISGLLSINDVLGIDVFVARFKPYFVIGLVLLAAMGLPYVLRIISRSYLRGLIAITLILSLSVAIWHYNATTYAAYENPQQYRRIHPDEAAAILWLKETVPHQAVIYSTEINRHSEWIPILSHHRWVPFRPGEERLIVKAHDGDRFLLYFLKRESVPEEIINNPTQFPIVYNHGQAIIFRVL